MSPPLPIVSFRLSADGPDTAPVPVLTGIAAQSDLHWGTSEYDHYAPRCAIQMFLSLVHMLRQQRLIDREPVTPAPRPALEPAESYTRDRELFEAANVDRMVVASAVGAALTVCRRAWSV